MTACLRLTDLTLGYDATPLLTLPALTLQPGEHCLIHGPSGSGKTTLLYALAGLLAPLSGRIEVQGSDLTAMAARARDRFRGRAIGIIYQNFHLVPALTLRQNLELAAYAAGLRADSARIDGLLATLGIAEQQHRTPDRLSHGQQQRAAVARAAVNAPGLLLGDEPTSALDDAACEAVIRLLLDTAKQIGATLVIATHDSRLAAFFPRVLTLPQATLSEAAA